jgi:hypothetical protein
MGRFLVKAGLLVVLMSILVHLASHGSGPVITPPALAAVTPHVSAPAAPVAAPRASTPALTGTPSTQDLWARAFLKLAGFRRTPCNKGAIEAWIHAEGSDPKWKNFLDDTLPLPGSSTVNSAGVRSYRKWIDGLRAAVHTLRYHPAIEKALRAGNNAQAVADAVQVPSTSGHMWGTAPFSATCTTG